MFILLTLVGGIQPVFEMALVGKFLAENYIFPKFGDMISYHTMAFNYLRKNHFSAFNMLAIVAFFVLSICMYRYVNNFFKYAKLIDNKYKIYEFFSKLSISILSFGMFIIFQFFEFLLTQNRFGTFRKLEEGNEVIRDFIKAKNRLKTELLIRKAQGFKLIKELRIPKHIEVLNLLIVGGMGSGKTVFLTPIILQFFDLKYPSFILDNKGDFCELLGEKEGVVILSPFDLRSLVWDVSEDISTELEAIEFVSQLIFLPGGSGDFFAHAARDIALGAIKYLQETKPFNWHMNEVLEVIANEELLRILEKYHPGGLQTLRDCGYSVKTGKLFVGETSASILQNVRAYLKNFELLSRAWPKTTDGFSVKKWARGEAKDTLFLIVPFKQLYPEISGFFSGIIIDLFVNQTLNLPDSKERRMGLFLDELGAIPRVKSLANGAKLLRAKGVCMFVGIQEVGVIRKKYEMDGGTETILNAFSIKLIGRAETPEYAEYFVRVLSKNKYKKTTRSRSNNSSGGHSISLCEETVVEDAISSGELMSIPPANVKNGAIFFLKMSDIPVIFKLKIKINVEKGKYLGNIEPEWIKRSVKAIKIGFEKTEVKELDLPYKIDENNILNLFHEKENIETKLKENSHENCIENDETLKDNDRKSIKKENNSLDLDSLNF